MTKTLQILYRSRRLYFVAVATILTTAVWLLITDLLFRYPLTGVMLFHLKRQFGFWPAVDHGLRGFMGIYMEGKGAHLATTFIACLIFFVSQVLFINPGAGWNASMLARGRPRVASVSALAMIAAFLTVGFVSMLLELGGLWATIPGAKTKVLGFILEPSFWVAMPLFLIGWLLWTLFLRAKWRGADGYLQLVHVLFWLFVAAGAELFLGGLLEARSGFEGQFWLRGTFTTSVIGATVLLWTLAPAVTLLYAAQRYDQGKGCLCPECGTILEVILDATGCVPCPSCGLAIRPDTPGHTSSPAST